MSNFNFYLASTVSHLVYTFNPFRYLLFIVK